MFTLRVSVILFLTFYSCNGAKILGVFPFFSYSHYILGHRLFEELARKGHEVTVINPYSNKSTSNYKNVYLDGIEKHVMEVITDLSNNDRTADMEKMPTFVMQLLLNQMTLAAGDFIYKDKNVQSILKQKFDVVIVEQFYNDAMKGFCYHFGAHCIAFSPIGASQANNYLVYNPSPSSYISDIFLPYSSKMSFLQRTHNYLYGILSDLINVYYLHKQNLQLHEYFPTAPHIYDLIKNMSVIFLNSHISTNPAVPHVPNMIEVGGLHIKPPQKLPNDLQKYLDDAKEGVVYFSLGSNVKSKELPLAKREDIVKAFSKLKLKVLWKFEDEELPNKPNNVMIKKWLPQQDILAHPNVKLFITHGGLLSTTEAIYHGVPLIGIPFFGDQRANMQESIRKGIAIQINFQDLNEETLTNALNTILKNDSFIKNAKKRSLILHDRPMNALDTAVYWVEYVLRHNGAHHLKTSAIDLVWYQYYLLDVLLFLSCIIMILIMGIYKLIKCCRGRKACMKKCGNKEICNKSKRGRKDKKE